MKAKRSLLRPATRIVYVSESTIKRIIAELDAMAVEYKKAREVEEIAEAQLTLTKFALLKCLDNLKAEVENGP